LRSHKDSTSLKQIRTLQYIVMMQFFEICFQLLNYHLLGKL